MLEKFRNVMESKLSQGSFAGNVVTLMTGTVLAQLLQLLITPILTRLYSPGDFGIFSIYISLVEIIVVVACIRYEAAIVIAENDETAANIFTLCILISMGVVALTLCIIAFSRGAIAGIFNFAELAYYLWFLPLSVMAAGLFLPFNYWSIRRNQFKRLAVRQVTGTSATAVTQFGAGIAFTPGPGGLIFGSIIGQTVATAKLAWQIFKEEGREILAFVAKPQLKEAAIRYKRFPLYDSWAAILNSISYMIPVFLLAYYFTPAVVGFYALGSRVLSIPGTLVGRAVYQVFFQQAAEAHRRGDLAGITLKVFKGLLNISFVPLALITIAAPDLFSIVFGPGWHVAGEYVQWLSLAIFLNFIASPISSIYDVLERQHKNLLFNIVLLVVRTSGLVIGGLHNDPILALKLFGLGSAAMFLYFLVYILNMSGSSIAKAGKIMASELLLSLPYLAFPAVVYILLRNPLGLVISAIVAGMVFVYRLLKKFGNTKEGVEA